jgi:hypothetical protein
VLTDANVDLLFTPRFDLYREQGLGTPGNVNGPAPVSGPASGLPAVTESPETYTVMNPNGTAVDPTSTNSDGAVLAPPIVN